MRQVTARTPAFSPEPGEAASEQGGGRLERQLFIALRGGMLLLVSGSGRLFGARAAVSDIPAAITRPIWPSPATMTSSVLMPRSLQEGRA